MFAGVTARSMSSSSCISGSSIASRPAVSKMTTSQPLRTASRLASLQIVTGSLPSWE
jgi:hypothetical protein